MHYAALHFAQNKRHFCLPVIGDVRRFIKGEIVRGIVIGVVLIYLFLGVGCATTQHREEALQWSFKNGHWEPGYTQEIRGKYRIVEFVPKGESVEDWSELITIQTFANTSGSPEAFINQLKTLREKKCPGSTIWSVIAKDERSMLYEWKAKPCAGWPDQHEISRILYGKWNRWRIAYTAKVQEISTEKRNMWIRSLSKATIKEKQQ